MNNPRLRAHDVFVWAASQPETAEETLTSEICRHFPEMAADVAANVAHSVKQWFASRKSYRP